MALKYIWIGSTGPFIFDDEASYSDDPTLNFKGIRTTSVIRIEGTPTANEDAARLQDVETMSASFRRHATVRLTDGAAAGKVSIEIINTYNADEVAATEVAKGATEGVFTLGANGNVLIISADAFSIDPVDVFAVMGLNYCGTALNCGASVSEGEVTITFLRNDASPADLTELVDVGDIYIELLYVAV